MRIWNAAFPSLQTPAVDPGSDTYATSVSLDVQAPLNTVFRIVNATTNQDSPPNPYFYFGCGVVGDGINDLNSPPLTNAARTFAAATDGLFSFSFDATGSPSNISGSVRFEFTVEMETAPGSGVFVPVSPDLAEITFSDGDGFALSNLDPPAFCFWIEETPNTYQICDSEPPPEPTLEPYWEVIPLSGFVSEWPSPGTPVAFPWEEDLQPAEGYMRCNMYSDFVPPAGYRIAGFRASAEYTTTPGFGMAAVVFGISGDIGGNLLAGESITSGSVSFVDKEYDSNFGDYVEGEALGAVFALINLQTTPGSSTPSTISVTHLELYIEPVL